MVDLFEPTGEMKLHAALRLAAVAVDKASAE
jgi:hypothetical protein